MPAACLSGARRSSVGRQADGDAAVAAGPCADEDESSHNAFSALAACGWTTRQAAGADRQRRAASGLEPGEQVRQELRRVDFDCHTHRLWPHDAEGGGRRHRPNVSDGVGDPVVPTHPRRADRRRSGEATRGATMPSPGGVPERPKGTGCKPVGSAYGGSNPPAPIAAGSRQASSGSGDSPQERYARGRMFWFTWKRLSGSYFALILASRS